MELRANHTQLCHVLTVALALLVGAVAADQPPSPTPPPNQTLPGCNYTCGDVKIPYPFGTGYSTINQQPCFLNDNFNLSCENSTLRFYDTNATIQDINLEGHMQESFFVSSLCKESDEEANQPFFHYPSFTISSRENKFITVGCNSFGYLNSNYEGATYTTGCTTMCYNSDPDMIIGNSSDGKCAGLGCCQVDIPPRMTNFTIQVYEFPNSTLPFYPKKKKKKNPSLAKNKKHCSYSFIAKQGSYKFSVDHLRKLPNETFPLVVNWAVANESCEMAQKNKSDYACKGNSECVDNDTDYKGYRCKCKDGFEGNPYLPEGCRGVAKPEIERSGPEDVGATLVTTSGDGEDARDPIADYDEEDLFEDPDDDFYLS